MRCLALLLTGLLGWLGQAHAQGMDVQLAPSATVACMTPPAAQRGEPEYPFDPWKRGEGGRVLVDLIFTGRDLRPEFKLIRKEGDDALVNAVEQHVATLRVPCLDDADVPLRLRQDYVFEPDRRKVSWTVPVDAADSQRRLQLKCMAANDGSKSPDYPTWARRDGVAGNVLVELRFPGPDQAPTVTAYAGSRLMRRMAATSIEPWAQKLRLPCAERPVDAVMAFKYRLEGDPAFGFKNITFMQWLRSVKGLRQMQVSFDTGQMGCPFDVKLNYRQPHFPNYVGQVGEPDARRRGLLEWLSMHVLDLRSEQLDAVLGDDATFTVPCIKIDLKPKE